jgi:hypothetical protein
MHSNTHGSQTAENNSQNLGKRVGDNLIIHFSARRTLKAGIGAVKFLNVIRHVSINGEDKKDKDGNQPPLQSRNSKLQRGANLS